MKYVAEVKSVAVPGINKVFVGLSSDGEQMLEDMPNAIRVEIDEAEDGTCFFFRYGVDDVFCGDSWFDTLDGAKKQGAFEYNISENDWHIQDTGTGSAGLLLRESRGD